MSEERLLVLDPITKPAWHPEVTEVTAGCGHKCWLSPGSAQLFLDEGVESKCSDCFGGHDALAKTIKEGNAKAADPAELLRMLRDIIQNRKDQ